MAIDSAEKRRSISGIIIPMLPGVTPNASKDAEWRQEAGWSYSGIAAAAAGIVYVFIGTAKTYSTTGGGTPYYEAFYRATTGTAHTRLYDLTAAAPVADSDLSRTGTTHDLERSIALTLTNGNKYRAQFGKQGADAGAALGGEIVVIL